MDCLTEDMALTGPDKVWISEEIKKTFSTSEQTGWRKASKTIVAIGSPAAIASVIVAAVAIALIQWNSANKRLADEVGFEVKTGGRLDRIEETLRRLSVSNSAITPSDPASQSEAKIAIAEARKTPQAPLPKPLIQNAGSKFVEASANDPGAWGVALEYASYRTELNATLAEVGSAGEIAKTVLNPKTLTQYTLRYPTAYPVPTFSVGGDVPQSQAANIYNIFEGPHDKDEPRGKEVILLEGGGIQLDFTEMKHVVIRNSTVVYTDAPMKLEDVIFVNCKFVLSNTLPARAFADAVLGTSIVNFEPTHF